MKYLVFCSCGHGLDRHDAAGCGGDGRLPCRCAKGQDAALEAAIEHARSQPWGSSPRPVAPSEAEIA